MMIRPVFLLCGALGLAVLPAAAQVRSPAPASAGDYRKLHEQTILADGHNDVLASALMDGLRLEDDLRGKAHSDLDRFESGGVDVQVFSVWCGDEYTHEGGFRRANSEIDVLEETIRRNTARMELVRDYQELKNATDQGKLAAIIGVEGGHMIDEDLACLDSLYARGARYLTLTWNNSSSWASSAEDEVYNRDELVSIGLSDFGEQVVRRMNQLGMMVDLSHTGDSTFWDAMAIVTRPVILSHSSAYALCAHYRNLKDEQIKAVARNGGVICVNFYSAYIDPAYNGKVKALVKKYPQEADSLRKGLGSDFAIGSQLLQLHPGERAALRPPLSLLIDHIDYIARLAGVDHVGLGSDFDGVSSLPLGLDDVSDYPRITEGLKKRGYSDEDVRKILGGNFLRVFRENTSL